MRNMYHRPWKKRKNNAIAIKKITMPYITIKGDEKFLFLADTEFYTIDDITNWINIFKKCYPTVSYVVFPDNMFKAMPKITGKEYTMLNNLLKRCKQ